MINVLSGWTEYEMFRVDVDFLHLSSCRARLFDYILLQDLVVLITDIIFFLVQFRQRVAISFGKEIYSLERQ